MSFIKNITNINQDIEKPTEVPSTTLVGTITENANRPITVVRIETKDYNDLRNKPSVNNVILEGALSFDDLGIEYITEEDINVMFEGSEL